MTAFRRTQLRAVIEAIVRGLAPQVCSLSSLQAAVRSVAEDPRLWAELDASWPLTVRGVATMTTSSVMQVNE